LRSRAIADCADLGIVPTLTRHTLRSETFLQATSAQSSPGARAVLLRLGAIARRTCLLSPILGDALENESAGTDEVPPSGQRCIASHVNSRYLSSVHARADMASRIVPTSSASNPAVSARPRTTSAQSPGRRNRRCADVGTTLIRCARHRIENRPRCVEMCPAGRRTRAGSSILANFVPALHSLEKLVAAEASPTEYAVRSFEES
jgi:hypothetical protein